MEKINEFLQSDQWRKFQESVGRRTFCISPHPSPLPKKGEGKFYFYASIIEHELPIVGKYFYIPKGSIIENPKSEILNPKQIPNSKSEIQIFLDNIIGLAKKEKAGWIRIEPASEEILNIFQGLALKVVKAPHDMQPREVFVIDITKSEEELLAEMKSKTRYNIKVAQKKGVKIIVIPAQAGIQAQRLDSGSEAGMTGRYIDEFIRLVKITAKRDGITPHPESYYRQMFETIPSENIKLYVAEYQEKIIAANIVIYYGNTVIYLHGASDNEYRNVMAPYLLQWQAILDAKKAGLTSYDFGGVKIGGDNSWQGITKFKTGFSPNTKPIEFPGSHDIIINKKKYYLYRLIQKIKSIF
jgi:peptidoglycan pentaglycine glycine transferase (the first glycine)